MNNTQNQGLGYDYAEPNSRLGRFIDEQHRLLERHRCELMHAKADNKWLENEAEYWKKECDKADKKVAELREEIIKLKTRK
jgi:hypothetical protein